MTLVTIGAVTELVDTTYSGFAYPPRRTQQRLIGNGTDAGNVAIQEGSKPYRLAQITVVVESTADRDAIRGYDEDATQIDFIDRSGFVRTVLVDTFSQAARPGEDAWDVTLSLIELTDPVAPGS